MPNGLAVPAEMDFDAFMEPNMQRYTVFIRQIRESRSGLALFLRAGRRSLLHSNRITSLEFRKRDALE